MKRPDTTEYYPSEAGKEWQAYAEWLERELSQWKDCAEQDRIRLGVAWDRIGDLEEEIDVLLDNDGCVGGE